jgi:SAM-dependent methyltransferase
MQTGLPPDIPSPIDLRKIDDARDWAKSAMEKRPWRTEFFRSIARELVQLNAANLSVLELGSGPGFLARHLLEALPSVAYVALDFSPAMHELAKEHLGALAERMQFLNVDFKEPHWSANLSAFDAVVTVQAVHELRHKRHAVSLYRAVRELLRNRGIFLMCDHFIGEGGMSDTALYMSPEEQEAALRLGGFTQVKMILRNGGLALFRATA